MHFNRVRVASLGLLLLASCGDATRSGAGAPVQLAGGESSEFSGGNIAVGFCPVELSHTPLDLESEDVAAWVALVEGHHEIPLRWRRVLPSDSIRGFEERTLLSLDLRPIAAEDVVCSNGGYGGYETEGLQGRVLRRFEFAVELATTDGAIRTSFQQRLFPVRSDNAEEKLLVTGGSVLPFDAVGGALELGVDPELGAYTPTLQVELSFGANSVRGSLTPWVSLTDPALSDTWAPVTGVFPAPDEGCEVGTSVPLDAQLDVLGATPRAAYEAARSRLPAGPITAGWQDPQHAPGSFTWTDVTLSAGSPVRACLNGASVDVYTSLRIDSADAVLAAEASIITSVDALGSSRMTGGLGWTSSPWTPSAQFVATTRMRDLDVSLAQYAGFSLFQTFASYPDGEELEGEFKVLTWENQHAREASPILHWCAGARCELHWCLLTSTNGGSSCL
jgi:hypothetical protein